MIIRVVDTETTGMEDPCGMVEIGWTDLHQVEDGWQIGACPFSELVNPRIPITFPAMAVHHIMPEDIADAITPEEAQFIVAGADIYCAHNAEFERRFLNIDAPWICTFKAARTFWPDLQGHSNGSIRYERGLCIREARAAPSHRAGPDTWITAHILLDLLKDHAIEELIDVSGKPVLLRTVDIGEHRDKPWSEVPWDYLDWIVNKSKMPGDPKRADTVHTARQELARRDSAANRAAPEKTPGATIIPAQQAPQDRDHPEQPPKGGSLARRAAMMCGEGAFLTFSETQSAEEAAAWLRELCRIKSRAELDHDERAAKEFERIDGKYRRWLQGYDD